MPGSRPSEVRLLDYRPEWPLQFEQLAVELRSLWADDVPAIEHMGSTAVPGLCAKPVIDVLLGVRELQEVQRRVQALSALGYRYRPEYEAQLPQRRYFTRDAAQGAQPRPRVHLHAVLLDSPAWQQHLAFRDALRGQPELARRYALLKRELASRFAHDKAAYTEAKAPFITAALASTRPSSRTQE